MPRHAGFMPTGSDIWTGATSPEGVITGPPGSLYRQTTGELWEKASGAGNAGWRRLIYADPTVTFNQSAYTATTLTVGAAVNVGTLLLLTDVIGATSTLQTGINQNRQLINQIIDVLQTYGLVL